MNLLVVPKTQAGERQILSSTSSRFPPVCCRQELIRPQYTCWRCADITRGAQGKRRSRPGHDGLRFSPNSLTSTKMAKEVKAKFDYNSGHEDDLSFSAGQVISVIEEVDDEWYSGGYTGPDGKSHQGMFPRNFVTTYSSQAAVPSGKREEAEKKSVASAVSPVNRSQPSPIAPKQVPAPMTGPSVKAASSPPPPSTARRDSRGLTKDEVTSQQMVWIPPLATMEALISPAVGATRKNVFFSGSHSSV